MVKSLEETAAERRSYIEQARASFSNPQQAHIRENNMHETTAGFSTLGIRIVIAILLFAVFIYCDQEKITFQGYTTQDVIRQIQWNPLPTEELEKLLKDIDFSSSP